METSITLPNPLYEETEKLARSLGVSRDELYAQALKMLIEEKAGAEITVRLDQVLRTAEDQGLDPVLMKLQLASLPKEEW